MSYKVEFSKSRNVERLPGTWQKKALHIYALIVCFVLGYCTAFSQDSLEVKFSEEPDTLTRQHFIDRYENVFMTKVPTRNMFKAGLSQYYQAVSYSLNDNRTLNNLYLHLGYEMKFLPAFSLSFSGYFPLYGAEAPIKDIIQNTVMDAQLRWFVGMQKRIKSGKSANNFSGNYISVFYNLPGTVQDDPKAGIKLGFQRRFLNRGFMDLSLAISKSVFSYTYGIDALVNNLSFSTQASFGMAFGDWKKSATAPLCDILLCNEYIDQLWKVRLPEITVGYYLNRFRAGIGYERKLGASPWTINIQIDAALNNGFDYLRYDHVEEWIAYGNQPMKEIFRYASVYSREKMLILTIEPKYYFLQKRQRLNGKGGNGLSGWYAGLHTEYNYYKGKHSSWLLPEEEIKDESKTLQAGPLLGFQVRLFGHGYLDLNTSYNFKDQLKSSNSFWGLRTYIGVGLAL